jgi:hypothetical protein
MRVILCCGDRDWMSFSKVLDVLSKENTNQKIDYVIEGGASGADYLSKKAAMKLGIQVIECPANWEYHHKAAGPIRNQQQLNIARKLLDLDNWEHPKLEDLLVLAFHSDIKNSKGTKDMVNRAKKAGVKVRIVK